MRKFLLSGALFCLMALASVGARAYTYVNVNSPWANYSAHSTDTLGFNLEWGMIDISGYATANVDAVKCRYYSSNTEASFISESVNNLWTDNIITYPASYGDEHPTWSINPWQIINMFKPYNAHYVKYCYRVKGTRYDETSVPMTHKEAVGYTPFSDILTL